MSGGMGRNGFFAAFFFCLIIADVSGAFFQFRKIASSAPTDNSTKTGISPLPSDATGGKESKPLPVNATDKPSKEKNKDTQVPNNSSKLDPKGSTDRGFVSSPIGKQKGNDKNYQGTEKNDDKTHTEAKTVGNCDGLAKCTDQNKMIACVQSYGKVTKFHVSPHSMDYMNFKHYYRAGQPPVRPGFGRSKPMLDVINVLGKLKLCRRMCRSFRGEDGGRELGEKQLEEARKCENLKENQVEYSPEKGNEFLSNLKSSILKVALEFKG